MTTKAIDVFRNLEQGIMNLVKSADLYTLQLIARERRSTVPQDLIDTLLLDNRTSAFMVDGGFYKPQEITMLERTGLFRRIGEQIVLATYTAVEVYLVEKFKEYFTYLLRESSPDLAGKILERLNFRSLRDLDKHYYGILGIHLPSFDFQIFTTSKCHFEPPNCWAALNLISTARNEIAHLGYSKTYKVSLPVDSWYPFEFVQHWVAHFDADFDMLIYNGIESALIREYKQRLQQLASK